MFYSKTTGGFYDRAIHGDNIPEDSVEITDEEYTLLIARPLSCADATQEEIVSQYESALDSHLDGVAKQYRYADRTRLALRAGYPNKHQSLASAFGTWMDSCNDQAKQLYLDVSSGLVPMPSIEEFINGLPEFVEP